MILENGVVARWIRRFPSLARSRSRVSGSQAESVSTSRPSPTPEVVDVGGRCVVPGFNDSHVHFPTWSLAQRDLSLDGVGSLADALERVRAHERRGLWIRGQGWRSAEWDAQPTKDALDEATGDAPAALWAKDLHSLWLNSAALALAQGDLDTEGGVVERDEDGEPTGVLREEAAWRFRERFPSVSEDEWLDVTRSGMKLAHSRGVTAVHDKDGWVGAPEIFQRLRDRGGLTLRVWQSLPYGKLPELDALGIRSRFGDDFLRLGYLKVFMDGTLGSQTAWMLDGSGVRITSAEKLAEVVRRAAQAGWPVGVHAIGDRANREALDAFEATKDEWAPRACANGSSMLSALQRRISRVSPRSASPPRCSSRTHPPTAIWRSASGPTGSKAPTLSAHCASPAPFSPTARMRRSRSSIRSPGSGRRSPEPSTIGPAGAWTRR